MVEEKPKKKIGIKDIAIIAIIIVLFLMVATGVTVENIGIDVNEFLHGAEPAIVEIKPADLELYKFNELKGNKTINIEIWLLNIGEEIASNITVHLRVRNQEGILFDGFIVPSTLVLRANESNTAYYVVSTVNSTQLLHTIEIAWNSGRKVYLETTAL